MFSWLLSHSHISKNSPTMCHLLTQWAHIQTAINPGKVCSWPHRALWIKLKQIRLWHSVLQDLQSNSSISKRQNFIQTQHKNRQCKDSSIYSLLKACWHNVLFPEMDTEKNIIKFCPPLSIKLVVLTLTACDIEAVWCSKQLASVFWISHIQLNQMPLFQVFEVIYCLVAIQE